MKQIIFSPLLPCGHLLPKGEEDNIIKIFRQKKSGKHIFTAKENGRVISAKEKWSTFLWRQRKREISVSAKKVEN